MSLARGTTSALIRAGLARLGIDTLLVTVHDSSFPSLPDEDIGRGTPYSAGAHAFLRFAAQLGFNALQLGPQGKTTRLDPSPYNGAQFARSHQLLDLFELQRDERTAKLIDPEWPERAVRMRPEGAREMSAHSYSFDVLADATVRGHARFVSERPQFSALDAELLQFSERERDWLEPDGLYEALCAFHGSDYFRNWSRSADGGAHQRLFATGPASRSAEYEGLVFQHTREIERNSWTQCLLDLQHAQLRQRAQALGLSLYADFQIGYAARDLWRWGAAFLPGYAFGAPPSRTNPDGQPWGYPVLNPLQLSVTTPSGRELGPAGRLLQQRARRLLRDFDGLRIDHPHGLVCPWVYDAHAVDPLRAVQNGARLRASPADPRHPRLAAFAIARPEDLSTRVPALPPYADAWVTRLEEAQVARYAEQFDLLIDEVRAQGRSVRDVAAEVLSTCPYPLARVLARHGLGRFRVVQKADPNDEEDPYRSARARPEDWIMLGTHDTPTIWSVAARWDDARKAAFASYLALRLVAPSERGAFAARLARDRNALIHALFADLFLGPARHVSIFFADLFGMEETYNAPGTVADTNWRLRVPPDFANLYAKRVAAGHALGVATAIATALRARAAGRSGDDLDLAHALFAESPTPSNV